MDEYQKRIVELEQDRYNHHLQSYLRNKMSNEAKFGLHQHRQPMMIDRTLPKTQECLKKIVKNHNEVTEYLTVVIMLLTIRSKAEIPCKQCLLDVALQFKDIGSLLEELCDGK